MIEHQENKINFCDFCSCESCKNGNKWTDNADTSDGRKICEICYFYECCLNAGAGNPCENKNCEHRPKLISDWRKFNG